MTKTLTPSRRRLSRPARIQDLQEATRELAAEYQGWLDALPESMSEGETADKLTDTIEQLEAIADGLDAIDPPMIGTKPRQAAP